VKSVSGVCRVKKVVVAAAAKMISLIAECRGHNFTVEFLLHDVTTVYTVM